MSIECSRCRSTIETNKIVYKNEVYCNRCAEYKLGFSEINATVISQKKYNSGNHSLPYIGIELEMESNADSTNLLTAQLRSFLYSEGIEQYYDIKEDGSLDNGLEVVTAPATFPYVQQNFKLYKVLEWLKKHECTADRQDTCGLHIHLDKSKLTSKEQKKLRIFFIINRDKLLKFSKRKEESTYAHFEQYSLISKIIKNRYTPQLNDAGEVVKKYLAINMNTKYNTIEFRLFHGTIKYERLQIVLSFINALYWFIKEDSTDRHILEDSSVNTWELFVDFCNQRKYTNVVKQLI